MMSLSAFLARSQGPSGFSFALMTTEPGGKCCISRSTAAAASIGSFTIRKAEAAAAATENFKNALRESLRSVWVELMRTSSGALGVLAVGSHYSTEFGRSIRIDYQLRFT